MPSDAKSAGRFTLAKRKEKRNRAQGRHKKRMGGDIGNRRFRKRWRRPQILQCCAESRLTRRIHVLISPRSSPYTSIVLAKLQDLRSSPSAGANVGKYQNGTSYTRVSARHNSDARASLWVSFSKGFWAKKCSKSKRLFYLLWRFRTIFWTFDGVRLSTLFLSPYLHFTENPLYLNRNHRS